MAHWDRELLCSLDRAPQSAKFNGTKERRRRKRARRRANSREWGHGERPQHSLYVRPRAGYGEKEEKSERCARSRDRLFLSLLGTLLSCTLYPDEVRAVFMLWENAIVKYIFSWCGFWLKLIGILNTSGNTKPKVLVTLNWMWVPWWLLYQYMHQLKNKILKIQ